MERKRHIFATIWIWFQISLYVLFFFMDVLSDPISSIVSILFGFLYVMLLFWYKWAFWGLIAIRLLFFLGLFNIIPIYTTVVEENILSHILIHIVFLLILFGVLQIKNKEINKSTWEQLRYKIRTNNI